MTSRVATAAVLGTLFVVSAPAHAQTTVVRGEGASAVVEHDPLRISFRDGAGRAVLRHLDPPAAPGATGGTDAPPAGFEVAPEVAVYAPLAFEVGGEHGFQHPGGLWTGNMLTNGRAGAVHFPTRVTAAVQDGGGVRFSLATTDPSRTMTVRVAPDAGTGLRVTAEVGGGGVSAIGDAFASAPGEAFRGFGGRHNAIDQRGEDFYNWIEEEAFNTGAALKPVESVPGSGGDRYLFPNGPHQAYYVQNLFVSSAGYGFLLNATEFSRWRMAADRPDAWQVALHGAKLDYTVAVGDGSTAIRTLTAINGRHRVPPDWALGPALKRNVQQGNDDPGTQQAKIREDIENLRKHDVRITGYAYESWDTLPEDFVRETNRQLRAMGIHAIGYVRAYVNDEGNFDPPGTFQEAVDNGYVAMTPTGQPWISVAVGPAALLDFTNPATVEWWARRKVRRMLDLGFDGFMQDFGEQVQTDMRFHDGSTGATMHNRYPVVFHRVTREIVDRWEREHRERGRVWMYTRAGFSGRPGSAAYEDSNFPGDESADWSRSLGIGSLATDMLSRAVGGSYGYTTDIGGYFDTNTQTAQPLQKDLFMRWSQWAALTPHFRLHNSCCDQGTRMPWDFDDAALANWKRMAALHERAIPLIRELWRDAQRTGLPPTRPMWLEYPRDAEAAKQDQQWMLGPDVLVAPVVEQDATKRRVYFPAGAWVHPETGERQEGPGYRDVVAPLDRLPYFFRAGTSPISEAKVARSCASRRRFAIPLPRGARRPLVRVDGRGVRVMRRNGRLRAIVEVRGRTRRTSSVRIRALTRSGERITQLRRYRLCVPHRRGRG
jgi:sulfoquinovosidase